MASPKRLAPMLLLLLACGTALGAPRERDAWYAYIADGERYGSLRVQVVRLPDGNYRYTRRVHLLLDVLGANKEEIEERGEYVVTPAYRPVSIEVEASRSSGKVRIAGREREGSFEISASQSGIERSREFGPAADLLPRPCLEDWLADREPGFESGPVSLLDEEGCGLQPARIRRLGARDSGMAWSVDLGPLEGEQQIIIGPDGLLRGLESAGVGPTIARCTAEEAGEIGYRKLDGRDLLMFALDQDVGPPERLTSLTVEIRWKGIPFEQFRLADGRQRVVEHDEAGGRHRTLLRIEAPEPIAAPARLPIGGDEFAPFLGKSRFIDPSDPRIAETARELIAGQEGALEAAKALSAWVSKNVEPAMIAETLSGPEVLSCRKGKCSEYATLFASLARSAGIPTRIVLGERMVGGQWAGHMWNEVYAGRWVTVDASCNEVGPSFALLKFVDHETVEGTQPLRRALPASLEIKIRGSERRESPLAGKFRTGIAGNVYTNADLGCRMTAPGADWAIEEKPGAGAAVIRFKIPGRDDAQLHFVAFSLPAGVEPKLLIGARLSSYKARLKGFEVIADEPFAENGPNGRKLRFKYAKGEGKGRKATETIWRTATAGYLLALDAEESGFEAIEESCNALIKSFEDLNEE
jgi:hypothetical protein